MRVNTETLDRFLSTVGEVILTSSQLRTRAADEKPGRAGLSVGLDRMDRVVGELQRRALDLRTTPLQRIVEPLPRVAREVAERSGKLVELEIHGAELELDRSILDRLSDPLVHLVRNAVDHGIENCPARVAAGKSERGRLTVAASRVMDTIRIAVCDDGAGIDIDRVRRRAVERGLLNEVLADDLPAEQVAGLVFHPGLSTAERVSEISGRGVGMDVVRATIESLGGHVEIETARGAGTSTTIVVPIAAAVQRVLLMGVGDDTVAIPVAKVERIVEVPAQEIERSGGEAFVLLDDEPVPVLNLAERLAPASPAAAAAADTAADEGRGGPATLVLSDVRGARVALHLDRVVGQQHIYVKPLPELLAHVRALSGLTILGNGRPVFVLDLNRLL